MAYITFENSERRIENQREVAQFLTDNEVIYEQWDISKLPSHLVEKYNLTDEEKQEILATFGAEIADISERRSYKTADVISLSPTTPNLDELLVYFQREHHHKVTMNYALNECWVSLSPLVLEREEIEIETYIERLKVNGWCVVSKEEFKNMFAKNGSN